MKIKIKLIVSLVLVASIICFIMNGMNEDVSAIVIQSEINTNLALTATATASSTYNSNYAPSKVNDGVLNVWDSGEWASLGEGVGAWIQLSWASAQTINEVWLYDRPNKYDQIYDAWLQIDSDGDGTADYNLHLGMFPYGAAPKIIYLTAAQGSSVRALKVYITDIASSTQNIGLSEIECYNKTGLYVTADGDVGIGTTSPSNTIQVANFINFDNTSSMHLTALGYQAGNSIESGGIDNTFLGYQAGTSVTTGDYNTAIGYGALDAVTTEPDCTAVGYNALTANTTGTSVTAVGYCALDANTTGDYNTAVGYDALGANTEGQSNVAFGMEALYYNQTGDCNTAVGRHAGYGVSSNSYSNNCIFGFESGYGLTTGGNNVLIGYNAGYMITTGADNVAVGYCALKSNNSTSRNTAIGSGALENLAATGNYNTAVGYNALTATTNGLYNVGVGYEALDSLSSACNYNTALGYQAGDNITTGDNNIIIGDQQDAPSATADNQLNIGGTIYGDLSNNYVGINTAAVPTLARLEINTATTEVPHIYLSPVADPYASPSGEGHIYMDDDGILYVYSNNTAWAACNTAADFSELIVPLDYRKEVHAGMRYYVGEVEAGDVIVIDEDGNYTRSSKPYDSTIVGVESGDRGRFLIEDGNPAKEEGLRQVGIVGHILVKVTLENGTIRPGDPLTTSSIPGHAMKATMPGVIVGKALESFNGSQGETGMIEVIVNPNWHGGA